MANRALQNSFLTALIASEVSSSLSSLLLYPYHVSSLSLFCRQHSRRVFPSSWDFFVNVSNINTDDSLHSPMFISQL